MKHDYLTTTDVLAIHAVLLRKYGGSEGIRDMGALESAVFRPQSGYYVDLVQEACALLESLLINHPFVDGNKRTAFAACDIFLRINSARINASPALLYDLIIGWIQLAPADRWAKIEEDLRPLVEVVE